MSGKQMLRILLVEDNPDDRILVSAYLKRGVDEPCEVLEAERLSTALQIAESVPIDICLLNLGLPDSSGLDTLKAVHGARPSMPIVVISGNTNKELALQVLGPERKINPGFIWVPLDIGNIHGIAALTSIITLTPGTVSSALSDDRRHLLVHVLNLDDADEVIRQIKTRYEAPLMEIFP